MPFNKTLETPSDNLHEYTVFMPLDLENYRGNPLKYENLFRITMKDIRQKDQRGSLYPRYQIEGNTIVISDM